jgi:DNA-binding Lrp family transcriptional regulator
VTTVTTVTESLDRQLVAALCRDGRAAIESLAEETGAVATTVQKRLRALEDEGVIEGYTARLNYDRLGYRTAIVRLAVDLDAIEAVTARLRNKPEFVTVYETSGPFTVYAVGKFEDEAAIAACLQELHADSDVHRVETEGVASIVREGDCPLGDD